MEENNDFLIDSNIVIYSSQPDYGFIRRWIENKNIGVSDISRIEVLGYNKLFPENKQYFTILFKEFETFLINEEVILKSIELRQDRKMSLGDATIAATALVKGLPLLTANSKDFQHLKELELIELAKIKK